MKIALIGYGKMGKMNEQVALERGHEISHAIDSKNSDLDWKEADVAIEFSKPELAVENIKRSISYAVPIVVGTTGWKDELNEVEKEVDAANGSLFHASNFSLGVNIFYYINQLLARIMNDQGSYDVSIEETHHTEKLDSPSGTAIELAEQIIAYHDGYQGWELSRSSDNEIAIDSIRKVDVKGEHIVKYESRIDSIELKHSAKNRGGFALGAILAAEFIKNRTGVYTMTDLLNIKI